MSADGMDKVPRREKIHRKSVFPSISGQHGGGVPPHETERETECQAEKRGGGKILDDVCRPARPRDIAPGRSANEVE